MIIDIIFSIVLLLLIIRGFKKGFIHAVVSLLALIIGLMIAVRFSDLAAEYLDKWFNMSDNYLPFIAFLAVFLLVYLAFRLLEETLETLLEKIHLSMLNKLAGAIVWCVIWAMLFSTILFYLNNMKLLSDELKTESFTYRKLEAFAPESITLIGKIIPPVKNIYQNLQQRFDEIENKHSLDS